mmetsp:Transcript_118844/g.236778  ORF Transcript_118844/g.236778 Transcript_118844/m.236778 type:complete len:308 (+) Transcript_118844:133-1056(+)
MRVRGLISRVVRTSGAACVGTPLEVALRQVMHSECAAVPQESLAQVVRLAAESEEDLCLVLRRIEEGAMAQPTEWRRIHGALVLLDRLMRHKGGGDRGSCRDSGPMVNRLWFEAKMETRLKVLVDFEFPQDKRVAILIRRAATAAQSAAETVLSADGIYEEYLITESCSGVLGQSQPASAKDVSKAASCNPQDGSKASIIGRSSVDKACLRAQNMSEEARRSGIDEEDHAKAKLRNAAAALAALSAPATRAGAAAQTATAAPAQEAGGMQSRWWCCLRRRQPVAKRTQSEEQASDGESNQLLGGELV